MIEIYAGKTARHTIEQQGFQQELFTAFLGASGGPKWFCLYALDKYLFGDFFADRSTELNMIGSSAGAFRIACFAQQDPVAAITRLGKNYSETTYSDKPDKQEVSRKVRELLEIMFAANGTQELINNPIFKAHFIVAKSNGLLQHENRLPLGAGLLQSYLSNRVNRKYLKTQYERFVFQSPTSSLSFTDPDKIPTTTIALNEDNIKPALLASGSIPLIMEGIRDIPGAPAGMYRDGGIIDYHFDLKINNPGLTLYPHFNPEPKAGWFDKRSSRGVRPENYDHTVLICPSREFVAALPFGKIPDRDDFTKLDSATRIKYWKTVFAETEQLAEQLHDIIARQNIDVIKPFSDG